MGLYCSFEDVRTRLIGKVQFTDSSDPDENRMSIALANVLINEGESQLELDLSVRYMAPFQTVSGAPFAQLPQRPTQLVLKTLAELQSVMKILDTDFGRGTVVDGSKYYEALKARYKTMAGQLIEMRDGYGSGWKFPPLPGIMLNYQNAQADDGFAGQVSIIGDLRDEGTYPNRRINDPSQGFWSLNWWNNGGD